MEKKLSQLTQKLEHEYIGKKIDPTITELCFDSRDVKEGSLFFALPGTHVHGNKFIPKAIEQGAVAIVFQDELPSETLNAAQLGSKNGNEVALIKVPDSRFAMSPMAEAFYDNPSAKLVIIGVTGTEGKSSTVAFVWQLLRLCGKTAGFISTVQYSTGDDAIANPEHQTTPEAPIVQRQLYEMLQNGCHFAVVESSSHGLSLRTNRLGNVHFDAAIWMNVTHEHLEFHGTVEQYKSDKANLFRSLDTHNHKKIICGREQNIPAFGVINLEDPEADYFAKATKHPVYGFTTFGKAGRENKNASCIVPAKVNEYQAHDLVASAEGINFNLKEAKATQYISVEAPLPGAFNTYNVMAAIITVSKITGIPIEEVAEKAKLLEPVKGRMTLIDCGQPFEVIVDYAHTPSSFETIFPPLRKRAKGKITAVFGSGGERDTKKRPEQGRIAALWCDTVILADEDPRGEDSVELLEMIAVGARKVGKTEGKGLYIIPDRKEAIRKAFQLAQKDDIVLLLGKAHENSIIYKDYVMPYDEISTAKELLMEL
ncbi:MAG: UDP-N-acetylmuramoyl-L-alanyl-D-glutamate--2,6-diaminopimelate ligase [Spirochaetaceae bacterium]|nr:UDP-N-acetylmuramoyl-L-alanyl-D-glutamate--2,6-diaminopimelate ligase [Spirochaetaceae bacterium]